MEGVGLLLSPFALFRVKLADAGAWHYASVAAILLIYAFIRFCASVRWYKDVPRYSGIELQFKKALVPTGYIMAITFALYLVFAWLGFLIIGAFLLAVVAHVDVILLYFHFRDSDKTPVNFYSSGRFQEDTSSRT
jgi:hypothetical protein